MYANNVKQQLVVHRCRHDSLVSSLDLSGPYIFYLVACMHMIKLVRNGEGSLCREKRSSISYALHWLKGTFVPSLPRSCKE